MSSSEASEGGSEAVEVISACSSGGRSLAGARGESHFLDDEVIKAVLRTDPSSQTASTSSSFSVWLTNSSRPFGRSSSSPRDALATTHQRACRLLLPFVRWRQRRPLRCRSRFCLDATVAGATIGVVYRCRDSIEAEAQPASRANRWRWRLARRWRAGGSRCSMARPAAGLRGGDCPRPGSAAPDTAFRRH
jgi:hypothetical protein